MKKALFFVLVFVVSLVAAEPPPPVMPSQITLVNGAVLRNCEVVRFGEHDITIKHAGGIAPVRYTAIAEPHLSQIRAYRDEMRKPADQRRAARVITGQVYITTRGAGSYKFSDATVKAYDVTLFDAARSNQQFNLPQGYRTFRYSTRLLAEAEAWTAALKNHKPEATAQTDADGKFSLRLPVNRPVFLFCFASRLMGDGDTETHLWVTPVEGESVNLTSSNKWEQPE